MTNSKTESVFDEEERAEIKFQNEQALKTTPSGESHEDDTKPHNLDLFKEIVSGAYGQNMKGRLGYSLNRIACNIMRVALRDEMKVEEKDVNLESCLSEDDIALMFGFESAPEYTLDQAAHWVMITFLFAHDVAQFTEANERGEKSHPYKWMEDQIKTPLTLAWSDMQYRIKAATDNQVAQMLKLGLHDEGGKFLEMFKFKETVLAQAQLKEKVDVIKGHIDMHSYKYGYDTEQLVNSLEEMISTLGLNVPAICAEIAERYKDGRVAKFNAGERLGEVDERILELVPVKAKQIGSRHVESLSEPVSDDTVARIKAGAAFDYKQAEAGGGVDQVAVDKALKVREEKAAEAAKPKSKRVRVPKAAKAASTTAVTH